MGERTRDLYRILNGDEWLRVCNDNGRVLVLHRANLVFGSREGRFEVGDFLVRGGHGPEYQELLRLIETLVWAKLPIVGIGHLRRSGWSKKLLSSQNA